MSGSTPVQFKSTTTASVTAAAAVGLTIPVGATPRMYRVVSDVAIHLKWANRADTPSAAQTDGLLPANCIEFVNIGQNDQIEIVGAQGVTTGTVWFSHVGG